MENKMIKGEEELMISDDEDFESYGRHHGPQQRNAANARERARMRVLSKAFSRLKTTLPWVPEDTKLSKLDTLRLATSYIAHLRSVLMLDQDTIVNPKQPVHLSWPYNFGHVNVTEYSAAKRVVNNNNRSNGKYSHNQHSNYYSDEHHANLPPDYHWNYCTY